MGWWDGFGAALPAGGVAIVTPSLTHGVVPAGAEAHRNRRYFLRVFAKYTTAELCSPVSPGTGGGGGSGV